MVPEEMNSMMYSTEMDMNMTHHGYELTSFSSDQAPSNDFVLESWLTEQDPSSNGTILHADDEDMMMVDTFGFEDPEEMPSTPPAGRLLLEEALEDTLAAAAQQGDDDEDSFFTTHSQSEFSSISCSPNANLTSFLPLEQRYEATLEKLTESMKKSQETRKSLRMQTSETAEYTRWNSVSGTLSSIEKSTQQLQQYLKTKKPTQVL